MKKYLFIWSIAAALCLSASARAEVCAGTKSCKDLNFTKTTAEVQALGEGYTCTACPLDGTKWACAPLANIVDPCEDYPYSAAEKSELLSVGGYTCKACPKDSSKYQCSATKCASGFYTTLSATCNRYEKGTCDGDRVWNNELSEFIFAPYPNQGYNCSQYFPGPCSDQSRGLIGDSTFINQYSGLTSSNCYDWMHKKGLDGGRSPEGWMEYRCQKGSSAGRPCLSSNVVRYYGGYPTIEPCKYIYNAEPYTAECPFSAD